MAELIPCGYIRKSEIPERPSCEHGPMSSNGFKWKCKNIDAKYNASPKGQATRAKYEATFNGWYNHQRRNWARYANPELRNQVATELEQVEFEIRETKAKLEELSGR